MLRHLHHLINEQLVDFVDGLLNDQRKVDSLLKYYSDECDDDEPRLSAFLGSELFPQVKQVSSEGFESIGTQEKQMSMIQRLNEMYDLCYNKLHTGDWRAVKQGWRTGLAFCAWFSCLLQLVSSDVEQWDLLQWKQVLYKLDIGIMMGDDRYRDQNLQELIEVVHDVTIQLYPIHLHEEGIDVQNETLSSRSKRTKMESRLEGLMSDVDSKTLATAVPHVPEIPLYRFEKEYYNSNVPVIIDLSEEDSPLLNYSLLVELAGYRTVPIEFGHNYLDRDWTQRLMALHEFVQQHLLSQQSTTKGYLAQHTLFDQIRPLRKYMQEPIYCAVGAGELESVNAWLGPSGTVSPLHTDPFSNILVQLMGEKYIRIYSSEYDESLYYTIEDTALKNSSRISSLPARESETLLRTEYPRFMQAPYWQGILKRGQALYIPKLFWHYVESLSTSFSVSFWFQEQHR